MSTGFGIKGWVGFAEEATYGTAKTPITNWFEIESENLKYEQSHISKPQLGGISANHRTKSKKVVSGTITMLVGWEGYPLIMKHIFGSYGTQSGAGPWTHPIVLTSALPTGLTIYVNRDAVEVSGSSLFRYIGCQITKAVFKQDIEGVLMLELDIVGKDADLVAYQTPTFVTANPIDWTELVVTLDGVVTVVNDFELTIDNKIETDRYGLGSQNIIGLGKSGEREVLLKANVEWGLSGTAMHPHTLFRGLDEFVWNNVWTQSGFSWTMNFPKVIATAGDPINEGPGKITIPLEGRAWLNSAENDEGTFTLIDNTQV